MSVFFLHKEWSGVGSVYTLETEWNECIGVEWGLELFHMMVKGVK